MKSNTQITNIANLRHTRSGEAFDVTSDVWSFRVETSNIHLNFRDMIQISPELRESLKAVLSWYLTNRSPNSLSGLLGPFKDFIQKTYVVSGVLTEITDVALLNYKAIASAGYMVNLRSLLNKWHALQYPGISDSVARMLSQLRLRGHVKGVAVLTMDPKEGPFTGIELEGIQAAVNSAFAIGELTESTFFMTWLFMALGCRPIQLAAMKVADVTYQRDSTGTDSFSIRVPRAKQRGSSGQRGQFKVRPLVAQLGEPLRAYAARIETRFKDVLVDPSQAPLFPMKDPTRLGAAIGFDYHYCAGALSGSLRDALKRLTVVSERTGKRMIINPRRFRRTFGTRAAQEGHGELVIAELLDHSDTQSVGVYVAAVPEIAERIDKALALQLAPIAQAFKGTLVTEVTDELKRNSTQHILDLRIDRSGAVMGSCGQNSYCRFGAPVACYTCANFQPWVDGPHEVVLEYLLARRELLPDARIVGVNDRTILAVADVVHLCRDAKRVGSA